jgi:putative transcriptional regulator
MSRLGQRLIQAAQEAAAFAEGKAVPGLKVYEPVDVRALRTKLGMSRDAFAHDFGIPKRTLQDWEQGRRGMDRSSRVLIRAISKNPDLVREAAREEEPEAVA